VLTVPQIKVQAKDLGFDLCGIAAADAYPELDFLREWLDKGYAGEMHYLERSADRRSDVRAVLPTARSVIVTGTLYNVARPYSTQVTGNDVARLARYAWGDDYHLVIGERLEQLVAWMREQVTEPFDARAYVDTGPVQERVYAQYAGLGWIGKNTCLINKDLGSWLFLSEIICSLPLTPDTPAVDHCGTCTRCLDACPTDALVEPHVLDSTRCLSYLTIELKGEIPAALRQAVGAHVYGCDICQDVCPWNRGAPESSDPAWQPRPLFDQPSLVDLSDASDEALRVALRRSAMKRTRLVGLRRNLAVAMANRDCARVDHTDCP
jgi:epoxyqueuosine reductase